MPRLFELQRTTRSPRRMVETALHSYVGEETLVVDERSRRSCVRVVDEKLHRLTPQSAGVFVSDENQH